MMRMRQRNKNAAIQFIAPFTWAIGQRWVQICCFAIGIYLAFYSYSVVSGFESYGTGTFEMYSLEVAQASFWKEMSTLSDQTFEIDLLLNGCNVRSSNIVLGDNVIAKISFSSPQQVNGFRLTHISNTSFSTPLRFTIKGSNDNGTAWDIVVSSEARKVAEGVRFLDTYGNYQWPIGKQLLFDNRVTWPLILESAVNSILLATCCISVSSFDKRMFALVCAVLGLNSLLSAAGYLGLSSSKEALIPGVKAAAYLAVGGLLYLRELAFPPSLAAAGLVTLLGSWRTPSSTAIRPTSPPRRPTRRPSLPESA